MKDLLDINIIKLPNIDKKILNLESENDNNLKNYFESQNSFKLIFRKFNHNEMSKIFINYNYIIFYL